MSDPFLLDQAALEQRLKALQENFDRWRQIRDSRDVAEFVARADEFNWLCVELSQGIKNAGWDLDDLEETLKMMSESRQLSITDADQQNRRQFIANARQLLRQISAEALPPSQSMNSANQLADAELLTSGAPGSSTTTGVSTVAGGAGSAHNHPHHYVEEPASLDLLDPGDGAYDNDGRSRWKRRLGASVVFGPLRQLGTADGGCFCLTSRRQVRICLAVVLILLITLLIVGVAVSMSNSSGATGNATSVAMATATTPAGRTV